MNAATEDLLKYIDNCPTPYHAVAESEQRLQAAGYSELSESESWSLRPGGKHYFCRGGTLVAFALGSHSPAETGFRIVGAHTDSPNLRVKPNPDRRRYGMHQLGVEVYGGVLLSTWMDRDLSLAGRVNVLTEDALTTYLVDFGRALLRIPNVAIHLNRTVNSDGLVLNKQDHLPPVVALERSGEAALSQLLADEMERSGVSVPAHQIAGWDLAAYEVAPATCWGAHNDLIAAPRLDNLASCHAAIVALTNASPDPIATNVVVLYDHEEVGSRSAQGAFSPVLRSTLERILASYDADNVEDNARSRASSFLISADMAHAVHPNYAERHEPEHRPLLGGGPVIKTHAGQAYATDGESAARFRALCRAVEVTPQNFVVRSDMPCGSTIGPITAAELGIPTVDVGNPMLAMHSCRETAAAADVEPMIAVLLGFFSDRH